VLALIEQGGKSFSAVLRRLHTAHRNEFRILARFDSEYLPENGYPYYTKSGYKAIMPSDFDDRVDVVPVSDPNIISNSQRIVQAQAVLDLAEKHPDQVSIKEAIKQMLVAIRVANSEELMQVDSALRHGCIAYRKFITLKSSMTLITSSSLINRSLHSVPSCWMTISAPV